MRDDQRPTITRIKLMTEAAIPEISGFAFQDIAEGAKTNCLVSRVLSGADIGLDAFIHT